MGDYRKLEVWRIARDLSKRARALARTLPLDDRRSTGYQLMRAANSVRLNNVEGAGYNSDAQFARCVSISLAEANEVRDALEILIEDKLLPDQHLDLPTCYECLRGKLFRFRGTLVQSPPRKRPKRRKRKDDD